MGREPSTTVGARLLAALSIALLFLPSCLATAQGALKLDNMTFDKMVAAPGITLLAKFDKSHAYGEKEDEFKELCKAACKVRGFLVGEVPVGEYGDKENDDLRERFGLKIEDFPAYFLFKGDATKGIRYEGFPNPTAKMPAGWDADEDGPWAPPMINTLTADNLGTWLQQNGVKYPTFGTLFEFDEVVQRFMKDNQKDDHYKAAKALAESEDYKEDPKAALYLKIMERVIDKGTDHAGKEYTRVWKLTNGNITPEKREQLMDKLRVLSVFTVAAAS